MRWFVGFTRAVNLSDQFHVENEKKRLVPFSRSPFRDDTDDLQPQQEVEPEGSSTAVRTPDVEPRPGLRRLLSTAKARAMRRSEVAVDDCDDEPVGERPPEWLELSGDLAWTATFSSLTSNTAISGASAVYSYAVFFALAWHLWATQTQYDIKFYTNDWWHRIFFIFQLSVYAALAAYSGTFNIFWQLNDANSQPFVGNATALTAQSIINNAESTYEESFQGVNVILAVSRLMLVVEYLRVLHYRKKRYRRYSWRYLLAPASLGIAAILFFVNFLLIRFAAPSVGVAVLQICIWAVAILIQIVGNVVTPDDPKVVLRSMGSITSRLSTLTVIVLGEGLNGICSTLRNSVNSLGFTGASLGNACCIALVLYFVWLLYFDGFQVRLPPGKLRKEAFLWTHLPFHLFLIVTLEGLKNQFLYVDVLEALQVFESSLAHVLAGSKALAPSPQMERLLGKIGMSWNQEVIDATAATKGGLVATEVQIWKWLCTAVHNIILFFVSSPDPQGEYMFNQYISNDTLVAQDLQAGSLPTGTGTHFSQFLHDYEVALEYSAEWVVSIAGALLFFIGLLNTTQRRPKDRYAWGSALTLKLGGLLLIVLGLTSSGRNARNKMSWYAWIIPTIALVLAAVTLVNQVLLGLSVRSINLAEEAVQTPPIIQSPEMAEYSTVETPSALSEGTTPVSGSPGEWQVLPFLQTRPPELPAPSSSPSHLV